MGRQKEQQREEPDQRISDLQEASVIEAELKNNRHRAKWGLGRHGKPITFPLIEQGSMEGG